jgi:polyferredoxin
VIKKFDHGICLAMNHVHGSIWGVYGMLLANDEQRMQPECKKLTERIEADRSQFWRRLAQVVFLGLNVWIGLQFAFFVRYFESGGRVLHVSRPPGVEGWLPIAGLMNLKYFLTTGCIPSMHPAAMFLLIAFLAISILFRKAFCGWLCPVGTLSEALWKLGRKLLKRNCRFPRWIDALLRGLKYLLLALFLYAIAGMSARSIEAFLLSPYGLVADVKMLHFFRNLSETAAIIIGLLLLLSIILKNFWCRYLCPYGAMMGLAAIFSPAKIHRDEDRCIRCAQCTGSCPALLKVDQLVNVRSAECTGCMECVAVCPAEGALQMRFSQKHGIHPWLMAAGLAAILVVTIGFAKWKGSWRSNIPDSSYEQLIPQLDEWTHP